MFKEGEICKVNESWIHFLETGTTVEILGFRTHRNDDEYLEVVDVKALDGELAGIYQAVHLEDLVKL